MEPYIHKVQYYETDRMQVTHHSNYVRFMEEARVSYLSRIGWDYKRMEAEGIISPVVEISCKYRKTTTFEDVISVEIYVKEVSSVKLKLGYRMKTEDQLVFTAESVHCFLNKEGAPINLKKELPGFYETLLSLKESSVVSGSYFAK